MEPAAAIESWLVGVGTAELVKQGERSGEPEFSGPGEGEGAVPELGPFACERPSLTLAWQYPDGRLLPVRCGASNRCAYCAWLVAAENINVVAIDAGQDMPRYAITLTTVDPWFSPHRFREAMAQWMRWLRSEVGSVEYLGNIEWTTGEAETSGGHRRMHQHTLVKGEQGWDLDGLWSDGKALWERLTGAYRIELRELRTPAGACAYFVAHHHKREQAPPAGFDYGKRFRPSRGYFSESLPALREQARAKRARGIALLSLIEQHGTDLENELQADELERWLAAEQAKPAPQLMRVQRVPTEFRDLPNGGCEPIAWETEVLGPASEHQRTAVAERL